VTRRYDSQPRSKSSKFSPPHNSQHRIIVKNLPTGCSWQDLKDHFRKVGDVCFADVRNEEGIVEYKEEAAMKLALETLDGSNLHGTAVTLIRDDTSIKQRHLFRKEAPRGSDRGHRQLSPKDEGSQGEEPSRSRSRSWSGQSPRNASSGENGQGDNGYAQAESSMEDGAIEG